MNCGNCLTLELLSMHHSSQRRSPNRSSRTLSGGPQCSRDHVSKDLVSILFSSGQQFTPSLHTSMASLFANALRTQARVALVASRARVVPKTVSLFSLAARSSTPSFARSLSSSRVVLAEYGYGAERTPSPPTKTLFVGNLPYSADEGELEDVLSQFGTPQTIRFGELLLLYASLRMFCSRSSLH